MKHFLKPALTLTAIVAAGPVLAAGDGLGIQQGFTEVGDDLQALMGGAGGFLIVIISISLAAIMLAIGRGWGQAVTAFAVALFLGYGVNALQGISGVTGGVDLLAADVVVTENPSAL